MIPNWRKSHIMRNENNTDRGRVTQMTKTLRRCVRMSKMAMAAITISCHMTSARCGSPR